MYRAAQKEGFDDDSLSWPTYLVLYALYGTKIPASYTSAIKKKYGKTAIKDDSEEYDLAQREGGRIVTIYRINENGMDVTSADDSSKTQRPALVI
ncbi:hypothetical protein Trihar35433_843 [Trichoderma harzianum]|nr:hypothetical protein Trihar35433_843 [Trichoderma harzianum]